MNPLILIGIAPFSWRMGVQTKRPNKLVLACGPLRLFVHNLSKPGTE